jgi:hypothetical protein
LTADDFVNPALSKENTESNSDDGYWKLELSSEYTFPLSVSTTSRGVSDLRSLDSFFLLLCAASAIKKKSRSIELK